MANSWMLFVDGENFTFQGQKFAKDNSIALTEGKYYQPDVFLWNPTTREQRRNAGIARTSLNSFVVDTQNVIDGYARRAYYFTTCPGDNNAVDSVKERLRSFYFEPCVYHKRRGERAKVVDIAMATEILMNAFRQNYEVLVLVAGDRDYVPLVQEVKRAGRVVILWFFENHGLSTELKLLADYFIPMNHAFKLCWHDYKDEHDH